MATYEGTCEHCGKPYRKRLAGSRKPPMYCSRACFHAARGFQPPVSKHCKRCGQHFAVKAAIADRSHYCSRECYWRDGGPGKNSPFKENPESRSRRKVYVGRVDGKPRYMHRSHWVWNQNHPDDPVRPGEHVHHVDGNKLNDDPSNLQKLSAVEHLSLHSKELSPEQRSQWMRAYHRANPNKQRKGQTYICPVCGTEFYRPPSAPHVTCSYRCSGIWSARQREQRHKE